VIACPGISLPSRLLSRLLFNYLSLGELHQAESYQFRISSPHKSKHERESTLTIFHPDTFPPFFLARDKG